MDQRHDLPTLTGGQRAALACSIVIALALATYGAVGSYTTISDKAAQIGVPFPGLVPIGIDGGLVGVITLDLVLAWTSHPIGWLRQLARLLAMGTVAANVSAGWPDPIAVCLYAAAPLMLLVMVEAGRAVLLRRAGLSSGLARDRIPLGRWLLSPWPTFLLWRRMVLWQTTSYHTALDDEARLRRTRTHLRVRFGRHWKRTAPADLVWMLNIAPYAQEAHARVETMIKNDGPAEATPAEQPAPADVQTTGSHLEEALRINERHWTERNRPVSAETLRKHLGVGAATARELTSTVRAMDRSTLKNNLSRPPTASNGRHHN
ncbi:DUF2637 domain-containing protein [Kibdelosporangium aridum]|uniref:DUF2637 domain-containing protein n=1 Tax=Kibdelosporangium aridum TaxID=2030 RepID=UPI0006903034